MPNARRKCRRVYHFLDNPEWAIQDLERRRIKISVFDRVHDERELRAYTIPEYAAECEDLVNWFTKTFCLLCFASDPESEHMWTEYGGDGKGVCFGFDVKKNQLNQIKYVSEMEIGKFPQKDIDELIARRAKLGPRKASEALSDPSPLEKRLMALIKPFLLTKFDRWKDEQELRAFLRKDEEENGLYFSNFRAPAGMYLQEVILGKRCKLTEETIRTLVADYPSQPISVKTMPR